MILIIKAGTTYPNIRAGLGDFEDWVKEKMKLKEGEFLVHSIVAYDDIPPDHRYKGIIITGSHSMVTNIEPKNSKICNWLLSVQKSGTPILGICYGHQLLSVLANGFVEYNATGTIIGSVNTYLTQAGQQDKLLGGLPSVFEVYKAHKQSVSKLPKSIDILATSDSGMIDAFRVNDNSWGVQFHPEFDENITKSYIHQQLKELSAEGLDPLELLGSVVHVDYGARIFKRFKQIINSA